MTWLENTGRAISKVQSSMDDGIEPQGDEPSLASLLANGFSDESKKEKKVYIEQLFLGVIRVNISYVKGKRASWESTRHGGWIDKRIEEIVKPFSSLHATSDVFAAWSRQTSDEDRRAEGKSASTSSLSLLKLTIEVLCHVFTHRYCFHRRSKPSEFTKTFRHTISKCIRCPDQTTGESLEPCFRESDRDSPQHPQVLRE
jgi:hypothetical protein